MIEEDLFYDLSLKYNVVKKMIQILIKMLLSEISCFAAKLLWLMVNSSYQSKQWNKLSWESNIRKYKLS